METRRYCSRAGLALVALLLLVQPGVAAAGKPGDCFVDIPAGLGPDIDLSNVLGLDISTVDAALRNGILVTTSSYRYPAYAEGLYWISNQSYSSGQTLWSLGNGEALRKDYRYPTNRAWVTFYPGGDVKTGYLSVYNRKGKLIKQLTFTSDATTVLDTGLLSGRIEYMVASFSEPGGQLGEMGYCVRWR